MTNVESPRRRLTALARAATVGVGLSAVFSCILAEPSGELPRLPLTRPTILHGSVVPSTTSVLGTFPTVLRIPVELSDPNLSFEWSAFIDYNPRTGEGLAIPPGVSQVGSGFQEGRVRLLEIALRPPDDVDSCHVIEVVVALRLVATTEGRSAHTPAPPGGDIVTWFYSPGGDLRGCPGLDAGIEAGDGAREGAVP
jgi:hypothetical protein